MDFTDFKHQFEIIKNLVQKAKMYTNIKIQFKAYLIFNNIYLTHKVSTYHIPSHFYRIKRIRISISIPLYHLVQFVSHLSLPLSLSIYIYICIISLLHIGYVLINELV